MFKFKLDSSSTRTLIFRASSNFSKSVTSRAQALILTLDLEFDLKTNNIFRIRVRVAQYSSSTRLDYNPINDNWG